MEIIQIRLSLREIDDEIKLMGDINPLNVWLISPNRELRLAEEVKIYGQNIKGERVLNRRINIAIPIKNIDWSGVKPKTMNEVNCNNFAIVSINRKEN